MVVAADRLQQPAAAVIKTLSVLLIDDNPARAEIVEAGLAAAGYRLLARLEGTQDLIGRVRELETELAGIEQRRDTRLLTDVAVPAMTAVRATPRRSPGIAVSSLIGWWSRSRRAPR